MRHSKSPRFLILAACIVILVSACGGNAGKANGTLVDSPTATYTAVLKTGAALYEQGMSLCKDLYEAGAIDKVFRDKVIGVAWRYWASYHAAQQALYYYSKLHDSKSYTDLVAAMAEFALDREELTKYVVILTGKEKK